MAVGVERVGGGVRIYHCKLVNNRYKPEYQRSFNTFKQNNSHRAAFYPSEDKKQAYNTTLQQRNNGWKYRESLDNLSELPLL